MVTTRNTGSRAEGFKTRFNTYLLDFGTTVTIRRITDTKDSMGRVTASSVATSSINADIQFVNKSDLQHLNVGDAQIGDGMLFTKVSADIDLEDELEYNGVRWRIVAQIEGEQVGGEVVYKGFLIRKNVQD